MSGKYLEIRSTQLQMSSLLLDRRIPLCRRHGNDVFEKYMSRSPADRKDIAQRSNLLASSQLAVRFSFFHHPSTQETMSDLIPTVFVLEEV